MRISSKLILPIVFIIVFLLGSIAFNFAESGRVVDAVSGKPIENILVMKRVFMKLPIPDPGGSSHEKEISREETTTNKEGYFFFKRIHKI